MKLSLPKLITVDDYHEFDSAKDLFKQIGLPVKVKEIGFLGGSYIGIVYEGKLTDPKVQKLINQVRAEEKAEDAFYN